MIDIKNTKKLSYCDFYIMQEHKFLRNILINLQHASDNCDMINELDENLDNKFLAFCWSDCSDCSSFDDIKAEISDIEIKNSSKTKISKFKI